MLITDPEQTARYYRALVERDPGFVGIFYAAVKTTGIFCIATCRARKPKPENVAFYRDRLSVQAAGFRPCKICRPDQSGPPPQIQRALSLLEQEDGAVSDALLRSRGINPEAVRRWFKQHYRTTFHAYRRMQRLSLAGDSVRQGGWPTAPFRQAGSRSAGLPTVIKNGWEIPR